MSPSVDDPCARARSRRSSTGNPATDPHGAAAVVIEILSPDDTYSDLHERSRDYLSMGVETVWIINPKARTGRMCFATQWVSAERLEVSGSDIHVDLPRLFSQIDIQAL